MWWMNEQNRQTKMNQRQEWYMTDNEWWDDDETIDNETAKWWKTLNKIWWIIRYNKFWRQYNMMNTIDNKIRTGTKQ